MFNNLTYIKKSYLLLASFIGFLIFGYHFTFVDTVQLAREIKAKEEKIAWLREKEEELPVLKEKMDEYRRAFDNGDSASVRVKLTQYISDFAEKNDCVVTEIPLFSTFNNKTLNVETNRFTIRGSFFSLLTLLNKLEYDHKYVSKIMSAKFYSLQDHHTRKKALYLTLVTQAFEQN